MKQNVRSYSRRDGTKVSAHVRDVSHSSHKKMNVDSMNLKKKEQDRIPTKLNFKTNFDEIKKGDEIVVESATSNYGKSDDPTRWWGARLDKRNNQYQYPSPIISHQTLKKILKEKRWKKISGGWEKGKLISTTTTIKIL